MLYVVLILCYCDVCLQKSAPTCCWRVGALSHHLTHSLQQAAERGLHSAHLVRLQCVLAGIGPNMLSGLATM
jgi:hypothetical protein